MTLTELINELYETSKGWATRQLTKLSSLGFDLDSPLSEVSLLKASLYVTKLHNKLKESYNEILNRLQLNSDRAIPNGLSGDDAQGYSGSSLERTNPVHPQEDRSLALEDTPTVGCPGGKDCGQLSTGGKPAFGEAIQQSLGKGVLSAIQAMDDFNRSGIEEQRRVSEEVVGRVVERSEEIVGRVIERSEEIVELSSEIISIAGAGLRFAERAVRGVCEDNWGGEINGDTQEANDQKGPFELEPETIDVTARESYDF